MADTIFAVFFVKGRQIHLSHGIQDEPDQVVFAHLFPKVERQEKELFAIAGNEVIGH